MDKPLIYLDNAATTAVSPAVLEAMMPCFSQHFGNPSSVHQAGREAKQLIDHARGQVARAIGAKDNEIYFTAGGSEADNWAIKGTALALADKGKHIITSCIEHHAILHACQALEKMGWTITYLPVDEAGLVSPEAVASAITEETVLVSIMTANNEIGTIQPIKEIGAICRERKIYFHTDAVQAIGHMAVDVNDLNVDMLSLSGHKFNGPKGIGVLYIRNGIRIRNLIDGGAQERMRRAGTENIAGIVGLGAAIEEAVNHLEENIAYTTALRERLIEGLLDAIPEIRVNGHRTKRLPGNVNVSIQYIEGEGMLLLLDRHGIAASTGSACASGSLDPSHVLLAIGLDHGTAHGSLRLSISHHNTQEEIDFAIRVIKEATERLRMMSPLYNEQ